jgi:RNA recognition motif-containing protein
MGARLFVGNLSTTTTEDDLRLVFSEEGRQVREVRVVTDRATGQSRGFAFVELTTTDAALQAVDTLDGREVGGNPMTVTVARERTAFGR